VGQTAPQPKPSTLFCPKPPTRADSGPAVAKARKTASTANYLAATCTAAARLSTARPPETVHVSQHQQREHVEPQVTGSQHLGSSRKLHLRPTHYDAQTAGARFTRIPRSMKRRNPRPKAQPGVHCGAAFGIRTRDLRITRPIEIVPDRTTPSHQIQFSQIRAPITVPLPVCRVAPSTGVRAPLALPTPVRRDTRRWADPRQHNADTLCRGHTGHSAATTTVTINSRHRSRPARHQPTAPVTAAPAPSAQTGTWEPDAISCPRAASSVHTAANTAARTTRERHPAVIAPHPRIQALIV